VNPTLTVEFLPLNSHLPPFNDVRVRRALDYAIDRAKIVRMYGGLLLASPLCQPLAPGMPGYHAYCPYTLDSRSGGAWTAPDLAKARRLVTASGTTGERVTIWGSPDEGSIPPHLPAYIASVLRSLGYRIVLRLVPSGSITPAMRQHFQLSVDGDWLPDFPSPSSYLPGFFGCHGALSNGYVCNPGLDRQMQQAIGLQVSEPPAADALWRRIDHEITDEAYWVPMVNLSAAELTSTRLRNYEFSPVGDFIADQAWLR
jgi:peptide/nickel transport system substrate-binding protein